MLSARFKPRKPKLVPLSMPRTSLVSDPTIAEVHWLVCHTKPRCEKKFAAALSAAAVPHYLPLIESVRHYAHGQKKRFTKPLFPSYVFAHVPVETQGRIYEQQLLVRTLKIENEDVFLRQIEEIKRVIASGLDLVLKPLLQKGKKVRILAGPLRGVEGTIDDPADTQGIIVAVDVLQQGVLVRIPLNEIEPVS